LAVAVAVAVALVGAITTLGQVAVVELGVEMVDLLLLQVVFLELAVQLVAQVQLQVAVLFYLGLVVVEFSHQHKQYSSQQQVLNKHLEGLVVHQEVYFTLLVELFECHQQVAVQHKMAPLLWELMVYILGVVVVAGVHQEEQVMDLGMTKMERQVEGQWH
jgi:hypothetical protein